MDKLKTYGIVQGRGKHYEEALYSLALLYNICNTKMSAYLKKHNLTVGKFNILVAIKTHGGEEGISQVEISKHLIVTPSNMTKLIDKLEKDKLVTRSALEGDRRVNIIKVTATAANMLDKMWDEYSKELEGLMGKLSKKDQEIISSNLVKWLSAILEE
ncbi:MAG: MarR family transcriptional regulator [Candidatus Omnitrophica bacterium]|nr:MarR family transcriptional regulator [Candidatus Omnitrophota bacterium]